MKEIGAETVSLECDSRAIKVRNDAVIVCAGGILPTKFLKGMGIEIETKYGTA